MMPETRALRLGAGRRTGQERSRPCCSAVEHCPDDPCASPFKHCSYDGGGQLEAAAFAPDDAVFRHRVLVLSKQVLAASHRLLGAVNQCLTAAFLLTWSCTALR